MAPQVGLSCSLFTRMKWMCGPNVSGNGSKNNSEPKKRGLFKETGIDYICWDFVVPAWMGRQTLTVQQSDPEDLKLLLTFQRDKDRPPPLPHKKTTKHLHLNTQREIYEERWKVEGEKEVMNGVVFPL